MSLRQSIAPRRKTINQDIDPETGEELEADVQDVLKYELQKLHKEFRVLENNRHGFAQREGGVRIRTSHLLPLLIHDRKELRQELRNTNSRLHVKSIDHITDKMKHFLRTYELCREETLKKIKLIEEIERHVDKITDKVNKQQLKLISLHGKSASLAQRERNLIKAEDRLYHLTCACNLQEHENKTLKGEISDILLERGLFFKDRRVLKKQLARTRNNMLKIVQLAIQTYDTRDDSIAKLKTVREREEKESRHFGLELQELKRNFHHYNKELGFIRIKLRSREVYEKSQAKKIRMMSQKEKQLKGILKRYNRSFKTILSYSHTQSIKDLVNNFKKLDFQNFEAFRYVTNLTSECEVLREAIRIRKTQIEEGHAEVEARKKEQRETRERLQLAIMSHQEHILELQQVSQRNAGRINQAIDTLSRAMKNTECDQGPIFALLGKKKLGRDHIGLCLSQLDIKISEIKYELEQFQQWKNVQSYKGSEYRHKHKDHKSQGGPYIPQFHMFNMDSIDEEDDKIIELEPYFYKEMKEFVFNKMVHDHIIDLSTRTISFKMSTNLYPDLPPTEVETPRKSYFQKMEEMGRKSRNSFYLASYPDIPRKTINLSGLNADSDTSDDDNAQEYEHEQKDGEQEEEEGEEGEEGEEEEEGEEHEEEEMMEE